jgi:hypothetical protein
VVQSGAYKVQRCNKSNDPLQSPSISHPQIRNKIRHREEKERKTRRKENGGKREEHNLIEDGKENRW